MNSSAINLRKIMLLAADAGIIFAGTAVAMHLRLGSDEAAAQLRSYEGISRVVLITAMCALVIYLYDLYDYLVTNRRRELFLMLVEALGIAWAILALMFYLSPQLAIGRGVSIIAVPLVLTMLLAWRVCIHYLIGHPDLGERIVVVGTGSAAREAVQAVAARRDAGLRVVGFVTDNGIKPQTFLDNVMVLGTTDDLESVVRTEAVDRVVVAVEDRRGAMPTDSLLKMSLAGEVSIEECTSFFERVTGQVHLDMVRPSWLIFAGKSKTTKLKSTVREIFHRMMGLIGFVLSLPVAVTTAILIKLDSKGPIFYRQERVGKNGRVFQVVKFRSMKTDAEKDGKPVWAACDDDRTTRVGRVIRKIRVDEIPQFWNIIKGEMSFVGPRPERPHFVSQLAKEIDFYEHRHLVAPGLTGWAQIKYPYGASVEDARQKLQFDLFYIKNQSLTLDLLIIFETVKTVLFGFGGR